MTEETLSDKRTELGHDIFAYSEEDVKSFIKDLMQIAEDNDWEVAIDDGVKDGFKVISCKEFIELKVGKRLI